ncbi:MAG: GIY-YIG nuclease family protein [Serratia proteamaculans]|jgi:putative endonuclease|uniref:GIY-YIG nuclease family protein n=1 Tax=Serratia proteamaculans TaxID=28151 RepID=UPI000D9D38F6|nr:GIY-YIG nuclease family protein [Serratia proteamaculans]SPZ53065.1 GIY-YIG nuclease superfamily protein [Serratia quinivorans]KAB1495941.1 GIY-YIG nuclease family protein [Serratia proteamaculans]CAI1009881.1 GIY-YIG nuclease superfamily protein [Serratia proteamaculans]CAI1010696.1 GIY-YIG nuclease superfamily protein [Serratia proteamaculans]CAI1013790.1 GIY-YIG nuclease superfamily protein [Serratia proteamaculans]
MTEILPTWHLYMLRMPSGMLYTGITTDVARRLAQHQAGKGAKALRGKGELVLAFHCQAGDRSRALRLEYRVKQLSKMQKERLVSHPPLSLDYLLPDVEVKAG